MLLLLKELNLIVSKLPNPEIAASVGQFHYRLPIPEEMPIVPLSDTPPTGHSIRFATFELVKLARNDSIYWRWKPTDDLVI